MSTSTLYVYGLDLISATDSGNVTTYYVTDGLGSTTNVRSSTGASVASYVYDVFGALRGAPPASANEFRFTGEQNDLNANRGLYYLRSRHYDPALGRFLAKDRLPLLNRYAYADNNPGNLTDPTGRCHDEQRYAHPALSGTPTPSTPTIQPEKPLKRAPRFDACSSVNEIPEMNPNSPLDEIYHFLKTNQCFRGITKGVVAAALAFLAYETTKGAVVGTFAATRSPLFAAGAGGSVLALQLPTLQRIASGAQEDIRYGC